VLARAPLAHEGGHVLARRQVAGCDGGVRVTDPTHAGVVAEQLDGRFQGLEVLGRQQDDVLAAVAGDVGLVGASVAA
jgi:hypothetical protein